MKLFDLGVPSDTFAADVLNGLSKPSKTLLPKYFYDDVGSQLFNDICLQPEYYPTQTEMRLLRETVTPALSKWVDEPVMIVEYGSGAGEKVQNLLQSIHSNAYVPIDISMDYIRDSAETLESLFPKLDIYGVCADFTGNFSVPREILSLPCSSKMIFFPGSTIGNFMPSTAVNILKNMHHILNAGETLLIGVDRVKDEDAFEAAYNDKAGATAAFNLNILHRINKELGADIPVDKFSHKAFFNAELSRVEMHLFANCDLNFEVQDAKFRMHKGESIHTENSYKFTPESFHKLAAEAGFDGKTMWTDSNELFSVYLLERQANDKVTH